MSEQQYTGRRLGRMLEQGRKLLHGLSRKPAIRNIARQAGYTQREHDEGWALMLYLMGYQQPSGVAEPQLNALYDSAVATLDQWDGPNFQRARAALERLHPQQAVYIFANLQAATGVESVGTVNTFVQRVVALRDGTDPARADTRAEDKAAVQTLADRNIFNAEVETYLKDLLANATKADPGPVVVKDTDPHYQCKAEQFDKWLKDWRRTLRVAITRKDYRIQLGLTERAVRGNSEEPWDPEDAGEEDDND